MFESHKLFDQNVIYDCNLFAGGLGTRPVSIGIANHLLKTNNLIAIVASINSSVIKMPSCQVNLSMGWVRQFWTFFFRSDT